MATPYLCEIRIVAFTYPPKGWAFCNGQTLPINQNQAIFALLGTTYGGNGQTTFQLPNLQGRAAVHAGNDVVQGQAGGEENHALTAAELPSQRLVSIFVEQGNPARRLYDRLGFQTSGPQQGLYLPMAWRPGSPAPSTLEEACDEQA